VVGLNVFFISWSDLHSIDASWWLPVVQFWQQACNSTDTYFTIPR